MAELQKQQSHLDDFHLLLVGTQNYDITQWTRYEQLKDAIHTTPFLQRHELYGYLKASDFLVYPGLIDGYPKIISESQACELLVIAFDAPTSSTRDHGKTGMLVAAGDVKAFAATILEMNQDTEKCHRIIKDAKAYVEQHYSNQTFVESYLKLSRLTADHQEI